MHSDDDKRQLTDAVKASVSSSGALVNLKDVSYNVASYSHDDAMESLKQEAQSTVQAIKQLLDGLNPDIGVSQKLRRVLLDLQTALATGTTSRISLETALAEATTAMSGADGNVQSMTAQQIEAQLWQRVEADNAQIDDQFDKMRKAGVVFNGTLWNKHKELTEYLKTHPRDIKMQKELDAVDDAMLLQAEPQIKQFPDAKLPFDDAKDRSKDRHDAVDKALAGVARKQSIGSDISMADFDDDALTSPADLTINDVKSPSVGQKSKSDENKFVRKQTNVCFRIKQHAPQRIPFPEKNRNLLICRHLYYGRSYLFFTSDANSVQR